MAGTPYQRGLYYDRCRHPTVTTAPLRQLIARAAGMAQTCERVGAGRVLDENRSPVARVFTGIDAKLVERDANVSDRVCLS